MFGVRCSMFERKRARVAVRRSAGAAMLLVVIALAVAAVLALSFLRSQGPTMAVASNIDKQAKARAVAESGLEYAINYVKENDNWRTAMSNGLWLEDQALNGGTFSVYGTDDDGDLADDDSDTLRLSVVAKFDGVTHRVSAAVTPGMSTNNRLLLVAGDASSPSGQDTAKKALFESWGYVVALIDDAVPDTVFMSAIANSDVIYVSEEAWSYDIGPKLLSAQVGIVNEEGQFHDDLRLTSGGANYYETATTIDIVENSHYITNGFALGTLTIYQSPLQITNTSRTLGSGVEELADGPGSGTRPSVMVAEVGAALTSGAAHGRRVTLPFGDNFDVNNLTVNGQTLVRRAIEWAAENLNGRNVQLLARYEFNQQTIDPSIIAHWQLEETEDSGGGLAVGDTLTLNDQAVVDSYDARLGAYGGANTSDYGTVSTNSNGSSRIVLTHTAQINGDAYVGTSADLNTAYSVASGAAISGGRDRLTSNVNLPSMTPPSGLTSLGTVTLTTGNTTLATDTRYNDLSLSGDATLTISGDVRLRIDGSLTIEDTAQIVVPSGSSLSLWVSQGVTIRDSGQLNGSSAATARTTGYIHASNADLVLQDSAKAAGTFYISDELNMSGVAELYGSVLAGNDALLSGASRVHVDMSLPELIDVDTPVRDIEKANHGSFRGDPTGGQPGATPLAGSGFSMYFDGDGDYVEMPHISAYALDGGTFSCWFRADTTSGRQGLFSKDSTSYDTGGHFSVFIENGKVRVRMQSTSASYWVESGTISTHTWYHIMFAWGAEGMVLYLDGIAVDTNSYTGGLSSTSGGTGNFEPIVLGGNAWQSDDLSATPVKDHFHGFIDDLRIYDERLNAAQAIDLYNGIEPGAQLSPSLVVDTSAFGEPLNLAIADTDRVTWGLGTLTFDSATIAQSMGDAAKVRDAILATGEFSLVVRIRRASPSSATGPARIASISSSTGSRNVTLGQESQALDVRVRTTDTGSNGILSPNYATSDVLTDTNWVHVVVAYDGELLRTYVDGTLIKSQEIDGTLSGWDATMPLLVGNESGGGRPWLGSIDELAIYDMALSVGQAESLASGGGLVATETVVTWIEGE